MTHTTDVPAERGRDELRERLRRELYAMEKERFGDDLPPYNAVEGFFGKQAERILALLAPQEAPSGPFRCDSCEQQIGRDEEYFVAPDGVRVHKRCCVVTPAAARESRPLVEALRAIIDMEPEQYDFPDDWQAQIAACDECQQYKDHPIQRGICDTHRRPLWDREAHDKAEQRRLHWRMRSVAREALGAHVLAAARPAPETDPEPFGWVVETQISDVLWETRRNARDGSYLWSRDEAEKERRALDMDGLPVRIAPVYLGAPAPAEATEPSDDQADILVSALMEAARHGSPEDMAKASASLLRWISESLRHAGLLYGALRSVLVADGLIREYAAPNGPEMLMFAEQFVAARNPAEATTAECAKCGLPNTDDIHHLNVQYVSQRSGRVEAHQFVPAEATEASDD